MSSWNRLVTAFKARTDHRHRLSGSSRDCQLEDWESTQSIALLRVLPAIFVACTCLKERDTRRSAHCPVRIRVCVSKFGYKRWVKKSRQFTGSQYATARIIEQRRRAATA